MTKQKKLFSKKEVKNLTETKVTLKLYAMAIAVSNLIEINKKIYALQFYDYDGKLEKDKMELVKPLFEGRDCIIYKTRFGYHFVSFTIDFKNNYKKIRKNTEKISKQLNQDYRFNNTDYLCLRISPKTTKKGVRQGRPQFYGVLNKPKLDNIISSEHLKCYAEKLGMASRVFESYLNCKLVKGNIKLHTYRTRIKPKSKRIE